VKNRSKTQKNLQSSSQTAQEWTTAEEIQQGFRAANGLGGLTSGVKSSALKTQRAKRDRARRTPSPKVGGLNVLRAQNLDDIPWLIHGFSTRQGGVSKKYGGGQLNLGYTQEDSPETVNRNRELLEHAVGALDKKGKPWPLVNLHQIHSAIIHRVRRGAVTPKAGDGLITDTPGMLLAVKVADCLPVIVVDRKRKAVGVFHAGWRGTTKRIVEKGVGEMRRQFGSDPKDLLAAIGPGIGKCCYEIGEEVESEFDSQFAYSKELFEDFFDSWSLHTKYPLLFMNQRAPGHGEPALSRHLDLVKANRLQLRDAGVPDENIVSLERCTACATDLFFSYRKERTTGRMMAVVGIRG